MTTTQSSPKVTIEVQPPHIVQLGSAITPTVKAKLHLSSDSDLRYQADSLYATAVVRDTNGNPLADSDYAGRVQVEHEPLQTAGSKTTVVYSFPGLCVWRAGTFRIRVSINQFDNAGSVVLCHVDSATFTVD
ncbi:hypothetical protein B0I37DRAFT_449587 [Chaetomium sp. MPI-CAGE-AT-0009]|nr:hypothetical protein B0I37DRAFT_449587 [Chaetomium sp. MPI-CAGE-AT-0009]